MTRQKCTLSAAPDGRSAYEGSFRQVLTGPSSVFRKRLEWKSGDRHRPARTAWVSWGLIDGPVRTGESRSGFEPMVTGRV